MTNSALHLVLRLSIYMLAGVAFLGALSRFTHGQYTPRFYAFQEYHAKDDGSATAMITPVLDVMIGILLLFRKTQFIAACLSCLFFAMGLGIQISAEKDIWADCGLIFLAGLAIKGATIRY